MTKVVSYGFTDTPISGVSALDFPRGLVNYSKDFRLKANAPSEVILTNITSPIGKPENVRVAVSDIANVYSGTGIEPNVYSPSTKGISVLAQVTFVMTVTDSTDPDFKIDLPLSFHMVVKVPNSEYITADVVKAGVGRLLSSLFDTGSLENSRLEAILRGSLLPQEV
jgi:hypothetical protein